MQSVEFGVVVFGVVAVVVVLDVADEDACASDDDWRGDELPAENDERVDVDVVVVEGAVDVFENDERRGEAGVVDVVDVVDDVDGVADVEEARGRGETREPPFFF